MNTPVKNTRFLYFPKGNVTQFWGENEKLYMSALGIKGHNGIDLVAEWGTPMVAIENGIVVSVKQDPGGYGKHVRYFSMDFKREWTYGHCSAIRVKVGDLIRKGEVIATMGNTGFVVSGDTPYWNTNPSSGTHHPGTHLHLGLRHIKRDGEGWAYEGSEIKINVLNYENGLKGSVDPLRYFFPTEKSFQMRHYAHVYKSTLLHDLAEIYVKIGM